MPGTPKRTHPYSGVLNDVVDPVEDPRIRRTFFQEFMFMPELSPTPRPRPSSSLGENHLTQWGGVAVTPPGADPYTARGSEVTVRVHRSPSRSPFASTPAGGGPVPGGQDGAVWVGVRELEEDDLQGGQTPEDPFWRQRMEPGVQWTPEYRFYGAPFSPPGENRNLTG